MRAIAILNRDGGTLKTTDLDAYCAHITKAFSEAGHELECHPVGGSEIEQALKKAADNPKFAAIIAGGGDGTISAAAGIAFKSGKTLGVIPAGTMNLFARSLGMPLNIEEAATALARSEVKSCDIATADGRPFVHQFSVGMQPRLVQNREELQYRSRFGKMIASLRATLSMLSRPPAFLTRMTLDGETQEQVFSMIAVANNPYGEGHMPYADRLDQGVLGVYSAGKIDTGAGMRLSTDLVLGSWRTNENMREETAREVVLQFPRHKRKARAVIDGELVPLRRKISIEIIPGALKVLVPLAANGGSQS